MSVLEAAIGWLAPPQCVGCGFEGSALCEACSTTEILPFGEHCWRCNCVSLRSKTCPACRRTGSPSYVWTTTNHEGLSRDLLSKYKFGHQRVAAEPIAKLMADTFLLLNSGLDAGEQDYLIVPVPTATAHIRERSFGHSELLTKHIARILKMQQANALRRLGQAHQLGARRQDRLVQLTNSFAVKNKRTVTGRNILLIDDVVTTGGTLISAAKTLRAAGASQINALVFAKRL